MWHYTSIHWALAIFGSQDDYFVLPLLVFPQSRSSPKALEGQLAEYPVRLSDNDQNLLLVVQNEWLMLEAAVLVSNASSAVLSANASYLDAVIIVVAIETLLRFNSGAFGCFTHRHHNALSSIYETTVSSNDGFRWSLQRYVSGVCSCVLTSRSSSTNATDLQCELHHMYQSKPISLERLELMLSSTNISVVILLVSIKTERHDPVQQIPHWLRERHRKHRVKLADDDICDVANACTTQFVSSLDPRSYNVVLVALTPNINAAHNMNSTAHLCHKATLFTRGKYSFQRELSMLILELTDFAVL